MKVTVNKKFFLGQALPIIEFDRLTVAAYGGEISVASFGNNINFRVPAQVVVSGQVYLTADEWRNIVATVQAAPGNMVEIEL